ncbi:stimulated by retinoic acid gene 6 protein-like isoform X2 [Hemicordylus capensis]|uniref:stimulated by retinoic acid gene 6 protein-like isoform X2 n=1 Tax=Hemicordylus capensis TaxID=884348 RepID=UPI002303A6D1|nr:stimulated by retinoic acid gene 6 protein-like isoform X2 [Hemicordylus capensis]
MATRMVSTESWQLKNETCRSSVDLDLFLHYSLLPSVAIIMVLSCLEKRARGHQVDERFPLLNRRPLDFVGAFDNRWSLGFAFGATANKVMIMFSEGDFLLYVPQWAQAFVLLIGAFEVGLSSYPFFACLSTCFQITGATLGFLYTGFWLVIMVMHIVQCPHGQIIGHYEKIMFYWPSLLCLVFLLSRFVHIFVKTLWIRFRLHLLNEETSFLEVHQAQYVQQLLRKPPLQQSQKSWIQRKVYDWDPYFRFPTRMISMAVLATICLYIFVVIEYYVYSLVLRTLKTLEENFEMLIASNSTSKVVVSGVQHGKELIGITEGVWVVTTFTSCLICVSYVFHILACYRKHMKRLWAGEKQFLPLGFSKLSSSQSVAAIARYSGWQIAYILWGQLVIHTVQCLFGVMFMYSFVLPIKKGQGIEMVKTLGTGILTLAVVIGLMLLQVVTAASFFLQPKISQDDKEKPLALDNRKVFHNFNYFLFFYNVLLGLGACLFRLLCSVIVGAWLIARIDRTIMPKGYEAADMGFRTWIGMLFMDHYHTNPTLVCFCHILVVRNRERQQQQQQQQQRTTNYYHFSNVADFRVLNKARTRWLLLYTLLNNPSLSALRKPQ